MASLVEQLDNSLADLLAGWNTLSTLILLSIASYLVYLVASSQDPDIHPMLLLRQSSASLVRKQGESAVYRSPDTPHGFPLRTGLNVKAKGAPAYAAGKDGDLRDVWRRVTGEIPLESGGNSEVGKILTVFGREVVDHSIPELTREIGILGSSLAKSGSKRVALYLPNSIEFLSTVFACAFYGLTPILLPYNQSHDAVIAQLAATQADALVAQAGSLPLETVGKQYKGLKSVVWVVEKTSRHVDWTEVPKEVGGGMEVGMWHQLVSDYPSTSAVTLPELKSNEVPGVVTVWLDKLGATPSIVEFSQGNLVAAISGLIHALPLRQRLTPSDLFLPTDVLTNTYCLTWTLAALFSHTTLALNSVAGPGVSLTTAARALAPTVILASAETAETFHAETKLGVTGGLKALAHRAQTSALDSGFMPSDTFFTKLNAPHKASLGTTPGKLRLLIVSERAGAQTPPLTSEDLSDLRIFTGARVVYALTAKEVAGALAQSSVFDYRRQAANKGRHAHFGAPVSSVEVKLVDSGSHKTTDESARGEIHVSGPAVVGGEARLGVAARFNDDGTIAYV